MVRLLNFEAVLYHDVGGVLREASLEDRPPEVRIRHHVTADEFATAMVRRLEARAAEDASAGPLFLVMPRLDPARPDFILVDLPRRLSVYLSAPPPPADPRGRPGGRSTAGCSDRSRWKATASRSSRTPCPPRDGC
ncbi:MAG: hypothetical protein M5U12_03685 [Verrucomicrobia bacterium]|nr:hypothetical protein [Verrucomicrobiota bacterium]